MTVLGIGLNIYPQVGMVYHMWLFFSFVALTVYFLMGKIFLYGVYTTV